ncbi:MAG TPA: GNAT family protein [Dehalococcoidia bacterium]|nr:GNAT family protein [Dehalococcoidia bacterium]
MIQGALVNLRPPELDDLDRDTRWINDREVTRYLSARYLVSRAAEEAWLRDHAGRPLSFSHAWFAIETKDGRHIGNTDLFEIVPEDRKANLGILIGEKDCWSKGYGTDAVRTLVRFAFDEMNLNRVELHVFAYNPRAVAAYRKAGFVEEGRMRAAHYAEGAHHDVIVMAALREGWRGAP